MNKTRKLMIGLAALGLAGVGAAGSFASFTASTSNSGTFATGSLVLSNEKNALGACFSTNGGSTDSNSNACAALFALTVKKPGDSSTVDLTIKNEGSLGGSALKAFATSACSPGPAAGETYNGTGDPCTAIDLYVQEFTNAGRGTALTCLYGGGDGTTCDYDDAKTLAAFGTEYPDADDAISFGPAISGATRYFTVGVKMPSSAGNSMQGRTATFGLTWSLVQ
jgi:hypothetical protein